MSTPEPQKEYLLKTHEYAQWMITLADSKASVLAGGAAVFVALVLGQTHPKIGTIGGAVLVAGVALVLASILSALLCLWPRVSRPTSNLLFYRYVSTLQLAEYRDKILSDKPPSLVDDLVDEDYALAGVQAAKYAALRWATILLVIGVPTVAVGFIIGAS